MYNEEDNDEHHYITFPDNSKVFDRLPDQSLLSKIKVHGIVSKVWQWIRTWLTCWKQRVEVKW